MTEEKRESMLRKVRALYAKANSTEHEGERAVFMAKADQLMEAHAIETWMLEAGKDDEQSKLVVKRSFDMSWWSELGDLPHDCKSQVWHLFASCAKHARCYVSANGIWQSGGCPVWGLEADLDYLDFLFTDLFVQLFAKIRPAYNPDKTLGENVMIAKEAGMKYTDIAVWCGHPEWRIPNGTGGWKSSPTNKMLSSYKSHLKSIGQSPSDRVTVHPHTYAYSFLSAFTVTIRKRFEDMSASTASTRVGGAELVLRDIREQAQSAAFSEFPAWAKHSGLSRSGGGRKLSTQGYASGGNAGKDARIAGRGGNNLRGTKRLSS